MAIGHRGCYGRKVLAILVAGATLAGVWGSAAAASGTTDTTSLRSGLPWASGVYIPGKDPARHTAFGDYRGAPTDVVVTWPARKSWTDLTGASWMYTAWKSQPQTAVYGFPPIPEDGVSTLAQCAAGAYNEHWRTIGQQLQATGAAHKTIIRLGWEFNGDWYAWSARNPAEFAECWRQIHRSADSQAPAVRWDWNVNRGISQIGIDPRDAYPGDAYVDIVGVDSYDWWPAVVDEASWQKHYAGAEGLKHWADFARSRGKKLSVPEWGVYPGTAGAAHSGGDNPLFIRKMLGFFYEQRDNLAYEAYFNTDAAYYAGSIFGPVQNPKASEEYATRIRAYRAGAGASPVAEPVLAPVVEPVVDAVVETVVEPVLAPTAPEATGPAVVTVSAPTATTTTTGVTVRAEVAVDRPVTFAKLARVAIRDSAGRTGDAAGGYDTAFGPAALDSSAVLTGSRSLAAGTYTAFVAYSVDGTTWVHGASSSFTVPAARKISTKPVFGPRLTTTVTRTSPFKRLTRTLVAP